MNKEMSASDIHYMAKNLTKDEVTRWKYLKNYQRIRNREWNKYWAEEGNKWLSKA